MRKAPIFLLSGIALLFTACGGEESDMSDDMVPPSPTLSIADLNVTVDENPILNTALGTFLVSQTNLSDPISYVVSDVSVTNSVAVDAAGRLTVTDVAAFDFEVNTIITGTVTASAGNLSDTAQFEITITDVAEPVVFISSWNLQDGNVTVRLPLYPGNPSDVTEYNFMVDWGDGTIAQVTSFDDEDATHTYTTEGIKTVTIDGFITGFNFGQDPESRDLFYDVLQWGGMDLGNAGRNFELCRNLIGFSATDQPNLRNMTTMLFMFSAAQAFNGDLSNWDVSTITDMTGVFLGATSFNQDISNWNTSSVTVMTGMFAEADAFNRDISVWDVSNVTDMEAMFGANDVFNQDISNWDVRQVTEMRGMFNGATAFDQDISEWDVSGTLDMGLMFAGAFAFDQDLSSWDVGKVTRMDRMFQGANSFNQDISNWDVDSVTDMSQMFQNAEIFSQDLSLWNTQNVTECDDFSMGSAMSLEDLPTLGCFEQ